jgi:UDP-GlcNAc:undecaprenyl-phosphate GlcNAc-1-phosphate transferase
MDSIIELSIVASIAFISSLCLTSLAKPLAFACGFVDLPDGRRKTHARIVPLGGGLAVGVSILIALSLHPLLFPSSVNIYTENSRFYLGCLLAGVVICSVGVLDDRYGLRGRQKLVGQFFSIVVLLWVTGLQITKLGLFGVEYELGIAGIPFTVLWLLGAVNALNLMDGIDGLAATIGSAAAFALAGMCIMNDRGADAVLALALGGALVGFLRHNVPPASIYLGDTGSMLIGLLLGTLGLHSSLKGPATVALTAPLAVLAIPFVDTTAAILRRRLTGKSIYATDRGHMHHVIMGQGFSGSATVAIIGFATIVTCGAALASVYWKNELLAGISVLLVIVVFVASRIFGYAEYLLLRNRILHFGRSLLHSGRRQGNRESSVQIQGTRDWNLLWSRLRGQVPGHVVRLKLDIDLPRLQEGFHANWERAGRHDEALAYQQTLPIVAGSQVIGRLEVVGLIDAISVEAVTRSALALHEFVQMEAERLFANDSRSSDAEVTPYWAPAMNAREKGPMAIDRRPVVSFDFQ